MTFSSRASLCLSVLLLSTSAFAFAPPRPVYATPDPECVVKSVTKLPSSYDNLAWIKGSNVSYFNRRDVTGTFQLHRLNGDGSAVCLSCVQAPGGPRVDRHKTMVTQHPSGKWIFVGVEQEVHDWDNVMPADWEIGLIQSGIWLDMWVTTPTGDRWWRVNTMAWGFVGTPFTSDGKVAVWAEALKEGNMFADHLGAWKLYAADFSDADGTPRFSNKRDITPADARWIEPGNFHPDNRRILLSTDIGLGEPRQAEGQDQWSLDIYSGALQRLNTTPTVWDEHGIYSPNGRKVVLMSSDPFKLSNPNDWHWYNLRTEFMLMNSDGTGLHRVTYFNDPGYPETQEKGAVAGVAAWRNDGSLFGTVLNAGFIMTNFRIEFVGPCGTN